jgi:hypothetical protein
MAKFETTVKLKAENNTDKALKQVDGDMRKVDKSANMLAGSLRTVGGLLAAAGAFSLVKSSLAAADALAKTSQRLGVSAERLQELEFAASQSGIEMNTLTMGLQRFGRRLAEAANGTGEAKDALKELGIETRDTDGSVRDTNEAFTEAVNKLGEMEAGADRTRLAFKLFDSEGVRLVQFGDGLDDLSRRANELGLVLDEELIKRAEEVNDQFDVATRVLGTQFKSAILELSPVLLGAGELLQDFGEGISIVTAMINQGDTMANRRELVRQFEEGLEATKGIERALESANDETVELKDTTEQAAMQADAFAQALENASDRSDRIKSNLEKIQGLREERDLDQDSASVLGALTKAGKARLELSTGNAEKASELALEAAEELRRVEEETGENVTLAGTFIKNFEKIAQDALSQAEQAKEQLKLVIEVEGKSREYDFTKEGVKKAGDDTSDALKRSEKKRG